MSKWRHERSSRLIRNLSNCEREAWKKFRLQRDSNPWPLRYRCSALPTELWSHNCWEQVNFSGSIMPLRVIQHSDWVCTAVMSKWRHERSSRLIRNLSNCEREAWKKKKKLLKLRINREDLSWRHLLITAVQTQSLCCITLSGMMDPLKLTCSQQLWLHSSVGRALHRYRRGHGFESRWSLNFFQASLSQLLKLRINREDLSWRHLLITAVQTQSLWCITLSGMMDPLKLTCSQQLWLHSSVGRALHRYRRGHGFESRWSLNFFQASLSQLLKLRINREDLSWRHIL